MLYSRCLCQALACALIMLTAAQSRADVLFVKCHNPQFTGHCNGFKWESQCVNLKTFEIDTNRGTAIADVYGVESYHSRQRYHDGLSRSSGSDEKTVMHVRVSEDELYIGDDLEAVTVNRRTGISSEGYECETSQLADREPLTVQCDRVVGISAGDNKQINLRRGDVLYNAVKTDKNSYGVEYYLGDMTIDGMDREVFIETPYLQPGQQSCGSQPDKAALKTLSITCPYAIGRSVDLTKKIPLHQGDTISDAYSIGKNARGTEYYTGNIERHGSKVPVIVEASDSIPGQTYCTPEPRK